MKELKSLDRLIRLSGYFHLALITPCVSIPLSLFFRESGSFAWLYMALGTIIPVELIAFICGRVQKKPLRALLSLGVTAAAVVLTLRDEYWVLYLLTCLPILISGLLLPRQKGRLVFTTPNLFALIPIVLVYSLGKIVPVSAICGIAVILLIFTVMNRLFYLNQTRLLSNISMSLKEEISVSSMIRQNQRVVACFLLAGVLVLVSIPLIMQSGRMQDEPQVYEYSGAVQETPAPPPDAPEANEYRESEEGKPLDPEPFFNTVLVCLVIIVYTTGALGIVLFIKMLIESINKRKNAVPEPEDSMTIERLKPETDAQEKERLVGYEKKIRRGYKKLIKSRAYEKAGLELMTPTELEQAAEVSGKSGQTIHGIYSRVRYGSEPATRESYAEFKEALRTLPALLRTREDNGQEKQEQF